MMDTKRASIYLRITKKRRILSSNGFRGDWLERSFSIEDNSFEMMMKIACTSPKKEKQKEVDLKDFLKSM